MEYMHKGIRFNAVAPGGMMTPLTASLKVPAGVDGSLMKRFSALRGLNEVDEVADMVAFLASDAAKGYHGAIIAIDQGITAGYSTVGQFSGC
jgi:NAD(P)-dependent dehydrogenase (short-subunit alcohol dehydrogenase family)